MADNPIFDQFKKEPPATVEEPKKGILHYLDRINFGGILIILFIVFVCIVAWVIIRDLSGMGSHFGSVIMGWLHEAGLNPDNPRAFKNFLSLVLTLFFIAGALYFLNKRK